MATITAETIGDDGTSISFVFGTDQETIALVMIYEDNKISTHIRPEDFSDLVVPLLAAIGSIGE